MVAFVQGKRKGIPLPLVFKIIRKVQVRGCSLKGSAAEAAVREFLESGKGTEGERAMAFGALHSIENDYTVEPGMVDSQTDGPCEKELQAKTR